MENPLSMAAFVRRPVNGWMPKESDAASTFSGHDTVAETWTRPNKANQIPECKDESDYFDRENGNTDGCWDAETVHSSRNSSSYDISNCYDNSSETPCQFEDEKECGNALPGHISRNLPPRSDELGPDDYFRTTTYSSSSTPYLSRSISAADAVGFKLLESGDDLTLLDSAGSAPPTHKRAAVTPPPSPLSLSPDDIDASVPAFPEASSRQGILSRSPDDDLASSSSADTIPALEDDIFAFASPQPPLTIPTRPRLSISPSCSSSSSSYSMFILPTIPRLYYKHSSQYSSQSEIHSGFCNILTNPIARLKARKRSVKESAAMDAELRQAHAEMRKKEMLFRQGGTQPPQYADLVKRREESMSETKECRMDEDGR